MLKMTVASALFVAAGGGAIVTVPASAQVVSDNHDFRKSVSRSHNLAHRSFHRNHNRNLNEEDSINRLRLPFNSTNNANPVVTVTREPTAQVTMVPAP